MSILNIFKKKKEEKKKKESEKIRKEKRGEKEKVKKKEKEIKEKKIEKEEKKEIKIKGLKIAPFALRFPHITEKATMLAEKNQYVFNVFERVTKPEIKKAIEEMYGVKVVKVRTINIPRKRRRLGRSEGFKSGYKKAIVTLKEGQKIEIMPK